MNTWNIKGHTIEYIDECHLYLVDGVILPSITQILKIKFGHKYDDVPKEVLSRAADKGTAVHKAIEDYCKLGLDSDLLELRNFKFLQKQYKFEVLDNEVPVVLFKDDIPVACGRLDLVLKIGNDVGLGDIKRTSVLDKEYLAYQLNLYRIAYQQCYEVDIKFLKGVHLRKDIRKFVDIPINEKLARKLVEEYIGG